MSLEDLCLHVHQHGSQLWAAVGIRQEHTNPQCFIDWFQLISCVETKQTKFPVSWMLQKVSGLLAASSSFSADHALSVLSPGWQRKVLFELDSEIKGRSARAVDYQTGFLSLSNAYKSAH